MNGNLHLTLDEFKPDVNKLHELIKAEDCVLADIEVIINRYQDEKHFISNDGESRISAAGMALKYSRLKIYEFLLSKNVHLKEAMKDIKQLIYDRIFDDNLKIFPRAKKKKDKEAIQEITRKQSLKIFIAIRHVQDKFVRDSTPKHILSLSSKTKFKHDNNNDDFIQIVQIYKSLNAIKEIEIILKVISTCPDVTIELDVDHNSAEHMVPIVGNSTEGLTLLKEKKVYVGAKEWFMDGGLKYKTLGTLAHELCHYAMQLVYDNSSKPYTKADETKKENFGEIVLLMKALNETEISRGVKEIGEIIQNVYTAYGDNLWHDELIVRVPHILALYSEDVEKLKYCKETYAQLFKFFEETTLIDLNREYPLMEAKRELCTLYGSLQTSDNDLTAEGLKIALGANEKNLFLTSNCPRLTINAIYWQVKNNLDFELAIIADAKTIENDQNFELAMKAIELCTKPKLIIDCDGIGTDGVMKIVEKFHDKEVKRGIVIISSNKSLCYKNYDTREVKYFWKHLTLKFQQKLLESKISFQGIEKKVGEIFKDLNMIDSIPFKELLGDQQMIIGEDLSEQISKKFFEKFVERKFLPSKNYPDYQPPNLTKSGEDENHEFEDVLNLALNDRTILLSDDPGMGKSISIKMMQLKLKAKFPSRWIILIDLKLHCESFQTDDKISIQFKSREKLVNFMCEKILLLKNFESELFSYLFSKDEVIILMDGLDEICPSFKKFVFELMIAIKKKSKNQLWISTRPHLVEDLEQSEILHPIRFKLDPFTEETRRECLTKFLKAKNQDDQNVDAKITKIENFLKKLYYSSMGGSIQNPLMFIMIAECFDEDENLELTDANLYSIYDQFTTKMVNRSLYKGPDAKLSAAKAYGDPQIIDFYQQNAFKVCFYRKHLKKSFSPIIDFRFQNVITPSIEDIRCVGLLISDGSDGFHFIHRTFAEFYVAKYFYEQIFRGKFKTEVDLRAIMEFFIEGLTHNYDEFTLIIALVENALEPFKAGECTRTARPVLGKIVDDKYFFLKDLIKHGHFHLLKSFLYHLPPTPRQHLITSCRDDQNLVMIVISNQSYVFNKLFFSFLNEIFKRDKILKILQEKDNKQQNILQIAAGNFQSSGAFDFLIEKFELLMDKELVNLLLHTSELGKNIIHTAVKTSNDIKNLLDILSLKLDPGQLETLLRSKIENENIFNFAIYSMRPESNDVNKLKALWDLMKSNFDIPILQEILLEKGTKYDKTALGMAANEELKVFQVVKEIYIETFKHLKTDWQDIVSAFIENEIKTFGKFKADAMRYEKFKLIFEELLEKSQYKNVLKEVLLLRNRDDDTTLMYAAKKQNHTMFLRLISFLDELSNEDQNEVLMQTNDYGDCALHCAHDENFDSVKKCYQDRVNDQNMLNILKDGDEFFFIKYLECENSEAETFCLQLQRKFQTSDEEERLRSLFWPYDHEDNTIFMTAASVYSARAFEILFELSKKLFDIETVKEILLHKNRKGKTAFHVSVYVDVGSVFEFVKKVYHDLLGPDELKKLILSEVDGGNILSYCSKFSSYRDKSEQRDEDEPYTFQLFYDYLKELLSDTENKKILKEMFVSHENETISTSQKGETPLTFVAGHFDCDMLLALSSLLETFSKEEQIKILMQTNDSGKCALHCGAPHDETFFLLKNLYYEKVDKENMLEIITSGGKDFILDFIGKEMFEDPTQVEEFCAYFDNLFKDSAPREKLKDLFITCDDEGENILMSAMKLKNKKAFETFFVLCKKLFDAERVEEILLLKGKDEATAFHFAIETDERKKFLTVKNIYLENLGKERVIEMLWSEFNGENIAFYAIENMKEEILEFFQFLTDLLVGDDEKLQELLSMQNKNGETLENRLKQNFKFWISEVILLSLCEAQWPVVSDST